MEYEDIINYSLSSQARILNARYAVIEDETKDTLMVLKMKEQGAGLQILR